MTTTVPDVGSLWTATRPVGSRSHHGLPFAYTRESVDPAMRMAEGAVVLVVSSAERRGLTESVDVLVGGRTFAVLTLSWHLGQFVEVATQ